MITCWGKTSEEVDPPSFSVFDYHGAVFTRRSIPVGITPSFFGAVATRCDILGQTAVDDKVLVDGSLCSP